MATYYGKLAVGFAVTCTCDGIYTIAWESPYGSATFDATLIVCQAQVGNSELFDLGTSGNLNTLDYRRCATPPAGGAATRAEVMAAIVALQADCSCATTTVVADTVTAATGEFCDIYVRDVYENPACPGTVISVHETIDMLNNSLNNVNAVNTNAVIGLGGNLSLQAPSGLVTTPARFVTTNATAATSTSTGAIVTAGGIAAAGAVYGTRAEFGSAATLPVAAPSAANRILGSNGYAAISNLDANTVGILTNNAAAGNSTGLAVVSGNTGTSFIHLGRTADGQAGALAYENPTDTFRINSVGTDRVTVSPTVVNVTSTTGSTSTTTGALVVGGGLGVGENVYAAEGFFGTSLPAARPATATRLLGATTYAPISGLDAATVGILSNNSSTANNAGLSVNSGDTGMAFIDLGAPSSAQYARIACTNATPRLHFYTTGVERAQLDSVGFYVNNLSSMTTDQNLVIRGNGTGIVAVADDCSIVGDADVSGNLNVQGTFHADTTSLLTGVVTCSDDVHLGANSIKKVVVPAQTVNQGGIGGSPTSDITANYIRWNTLLVTHLFHPGDSVTFQVFNSFVDAGSIVLYSVEWAFPVTGNGVPALFLHDQTVGSFRITWGNTAGQTDGIDMLTYAYVRFLVVNYL